MGPEGGGSDDAAGLPVAGPMAAAAAPAPAPPAAIGLLLATNLATMDEGAGAAWHFSRGASGLRGSGGESGRRCEAGGLEGVRLGRARLHVHARRDMKIMPNTVHENYSHVPSEARRGMFQDYVNNASELTRIPWNLVQGTTRDEQTLTTVHPMSPF